MTTLQTINVPASHMEDHGQAEEGQQLSSIKIRFKKGVFFGKLGDASAVDISMNRKLSIRLSPKSEGEKKRKAVEETGLDNDEHVVKRIKTMDSSETIKNIEVQKTIAIESTNQPMEDDTPASPAGSMTPSAAGASNTVAPTKPTAQAASIYRKLAKKLSTQPLLIEHLKDYRTSITNQHREDTKTIASLRAELSAATSEAAEKGRHAADELKASQDMVVFWTDSCNDEYEESMLLKEKLRDLVRKIEDIANAEANGGDADANADFSKGMQLEFELQKIGAELVSLVEERKESRA